MKASRRRYSISMRCWALPIRTRRDVPSADAAREPLDAFASRLMLTTLLAFAFAGTASARQQRSAPQCCQRAKTALIAAAQLRVFSSKQRYPSERAASFRTLAARSQANSRKPAQLRRRRRAVARSRLQARRALNLARNSAATPRSPRPGNTAIAKAGSRPAQQRAAPATPSVATKRAAAAVPPNRRRRTTAAITTKPVEGSFDLRSSFAGGRAAKSVVRQRPTDGERIDAQAPHSSDGRRIAPVLADDHRRPAIECRADCNAASGRAARRACRSHRPQVRAGIERVRNSPPPRRSRSTRHHAHRSPKTAASKRHCAPNARRRWNFCSATRVPSNNNCATPALTSARTR